MPRLFAAALAAAALLCTGAGWARADDLRCVSRSACRAVALHPSPVAAPAGAHAVGRIDTALTDPERGGRGIMVSAWYPTAEVGAPAPYVPASGPVAQLPVTAWADVWMQTPVAAATMMGAQAPATEGAPVEGDRLPVIAVSPGMGTPRWILSGLAADLASRGWVVVALDHTGESPAVEMPDGRVVLGDAPTPDTEYMREQLATRVGDMRLTLDHLAALPIVGPHLDLDRVVVAGHSYGGTTALQLAATDSRVRAVVSIDGPAGWDGVAAAPTTGLPVLLLDLTGTWTESWAAIRGSRFEHVNVSGTGHYSASDLPAFGCSAELCGTMPADRAATVTRDVVADWLDRQLRGGREPRYAAPELHWQL